MEVFNTILANDESIKNHSEQYSYIYSIVEDFVKENDLDKRKIGSTLSYWLDIICSDGDAGSTHGYYFESNVTENLCDHITKNILWRFENSMGELMKNKCKFILNRGL